MVERFEFRVWHKERQYMYKNVAIGVGQHKIGYRVSGKRRYSWEESDKIIILQSTGFKDSKGNIIFDGDILKFGTSKTYLASVHWDDYRFVVKRVGTKKFIDKFSNWKKAGNVVIVGNIYENPDLLKSKK